MPIEPAQAGAEPSFLQDSLDGYSGPNDLVTVRANELKFLQDFCDRVREDSGLGVLDSAVVSGCLLDRHISSCLRMLETFEWAVDDLDEEVLLRPNDREFLEDPIDPRRRVGQLGRLLALRREVFFELAGSEFHRLASPDAGPQSRALGKRFERAMDAAEETQGRVIGPFDLSMASTARKANDAVQMLTTVNPSPREGRQPPLLFTSSDISEAVTLGRSVRRKPRNGACSVASVTRQIMRTSTDAIR